jgi:hypothetical protein
VLVPNAQTIYPENMPLRYGPHASGLFDAVMARAKAFADLDIIDMRAPLMRHRDEPVFYDTDTHWNSNGAFYAAAEAVDAIRRWLPSVPPLRRQDYEVTRQSAQAGDLAGMLALRDSYQDEAFVYRRRDHRDAAATEAEFLHSVYTGADAKSARVMVIGDSFGRELADRMADSFARTYYHYSARVGRDVGLITREHPDVVVLCLVERYLPRLGTE